MFVKSYGRSVFPYYKVYFKQDINTALLKYEKNFHTIKSILNY